MTGTWTRGPGFLEDSKLRVPHSSRRLLARGWAAARNHYHGLNSILFVEFSYATGTEALMAGALL